MAEPSTLHTGESNELPLNGQSIKENGRLSAGRPKMESYMGAEKPSFVDDSLVQHYRERCSRLEGELHDSDRKIRLQVDEIMQLKRELSKDRTETLLSHQKEISELKDASRMEIERLKDTHRRDTREFERQINELERQAFKMELEYQSGDRSAANRFWDMVEKVAPELVDHVSGVIAGGMPAAGQPVLTAPADLPQQQADLMQQAFAQNMNTTDSGKETTKTTPSEQTMTPHSGEGGDTPPRSGLAGDDSIDLNSLFADKTNGHHPHPMEGL
jgi:hypothetical protein